MQSGIIANVYRVLNDIELLIPYSRILSIVGQTSSNKLLLGSNAYLSFFHSTVCLSGVERQGGQAINATEVAKFLHERTDLFRSNVTSQSLGKSK